MTTRSNEKVSRSRGVIVLRVSTLQLSETYKWYFLSLFYEYEGFNFGGRLVDGGPVGGGGGGGGEGWTG